MKPLNMTPVHEALDIYVNQVKDIQEKVISVPLLECLGKTLAVDIISDVTIPSYRRSTVDGFAVRSQDCLQATVDQPVVLRVVGQSEMGATTDIQIETGQAMYVPTGAMIPGGADTMIMVEYTEEQKTPDHRVRILKAGIPGDRMILPGSDMKPGQVVLGKGRRLRPEDIGALAALGREHVKIMESPVVSIFSTGDELVPLGRPLTGGQIRDMNTYSLRAACQRWELPVHTAQIVPDQKERLTAYIREAVNHSDIVLISGGSSMGKKDITADAIREAGGQVYIHGLAFKPGKPTILARVQDTLVIGLPGHPVSALMVFQLIGRPLLETLFGMNLPVQHKRSGRLSKTVRPAKGRETFQMVAVEETEADLVLEPIPGASGMITMMTKADGYVRIPKEVAEIPAGQIVDVYDL